MLGRTSLRAGRSVCVVVPNKQAAGVVRIATLHRGKGPEFDEVVLLPSEESRPKETPSDLDRANHPAGIPPGCANWGKFTGGVAAAPPTGYRLGCLRHPPTTRFMDDALHGRRTPWTAHSWTYPCDRFSRSVWAKASSAKDGRSQSRRGKGGNALSAHPVTDRPLWKTAWRAGPRC